eukprot:359739-Chlamydomonas_euryale.AAC.4
MLASLHFIHPSAYTESRGTGRGRIRGMPAWARQACKGSHAGFTARMRSRKRTPICVAMCCPVQTQPSKSRVMHGAEQLCPAMQTLT